MSDFRPKLDAVMVLHFGYVWNARDNYIEHMVSHPAKTQEISRPIIIIIIIR